MALVQALLEKHTESGWLLDGFPRALAQAQALESDPAFQAQTLAIALDVPKVELKNRIVSRRKCSEYGVTVSVSSVDEKKCSECNEILEARADDDLENFRTRYANYSELTQPLFDYYVAQGKLLAVNGSQSLDEVFTAIENHFPKNTTL